MKDISKEVMNEARERLMDKYAEYLYDSQGTPTFLSGYSKDDWGDGIPQEDIFRYLKDKALDYLSSYLKDNSSDTEDRLMKIAYILEKMGDFEVFIDNLDEKTYKSSMAYFLARSKRDLRDIKLIAPEFNEILEAF